MDYLLTCTLVGVDAHIDPLYGFFLLRCLLFRGKADIMQKKE